MLLDRLDRIQAQLSDDDLVLDVGGWSAPVNRANYVLDYMPYETRGQLLRGGGTRPEGNSGLGGLGPGPERFTLETWVRRDICAHEPWPFDDNQFDFVFCGHTLEDIRDPVWVCQEMSRVSKAGYIEVPSLVDELTRFVPEPSGGPWLGHVHHRWICWQDEADGGIVFLLKPHGLHYDSPLEVPERWARTIELHDRALSITWEGTLNAREYPAISMYPEEEIEERLARAFGKSTDELRAALRAQRGWRATLTRRLPRALARRGRRLVTRLRSPGA